VWKSWLFSVTLRPGARSKHCNCTVILEKKTCTSKSKDVFASWELCPAYLKTDLSLSHGAVIPRNKRCFEITLFYSNRLPSSLESAQSRTFWPTTASWRTYSWAITKSPSFRNGIHQLF
jgi:hypothetical protein